MRTVCFVARLAIFSISSALLVTACGNVIGIPDYAYVTSDAGVSGPSGTSSGSGGFSGGSTTGTMSGNSAFPSGTTGGVGGSFNSGAGPSAGTAAGSIGTMTGSTSGAGTGSFSGNSAGVSSGATTGTTSGSAGQTSSGAATGTSSGAAGAAATGTTSGGSGGASSGATTGATSGGGSGGASSGATSGASSGPPPACIFGTPYNGSGSFTNYWFGQGTTKGPSGKYQTACGYLGTESGMTDTVENIANSGLASNTYFAAIPGKNNFDTVNSCGACVEITNGGNKIVATIIDECPTDNNNNPACTSAGHLDLSKSAFNKLGYGVGNPSGTTWEFVACPVTGNIVTVAKSGNSDQLYIENTVFPVTSVTFNGGQKATHLFYGVWSLNGTGAEGQTLTLTDAEGHAVAGKVPSGFGDLGVQFPSPASCP